MLSFCPEVIHHADDSDEQGDCGEVGYLCENWDAVTCPECLEHKPDGTVISLALYRAARGLN